MELMQLNESRVAFDPASHTYTLDGKRLSGITERIRTRIFPDEYKYVPEQVLQRAAQRGSIVHQAVEVYDTLGFDTEGVGELETYKELAKDFDFMRQHVASEYLVDDGRKYASCIDKVYSDGSGGVILADIKTTSSLNVEYVSWQLSVYKYLFGLLNPSIQVTGGYAIWLRGNRGKVRPVPFKNDDDVERLLYDDDFTPAKDESVAALAAIVADLKGEADEAGKAYEMAKQELYDKMREGNMMKYENELVSISCMPPSERVSLDQRLLRDQMPDIYQKYSRTTQSSGGIRVTLR